MVRGGPEASGTWYMHYSSNIEYKIRTMKRVHYLLLLSLYSQSLGMSRGSTQTERVSDRCLDSTRDINNWTL